MPRVTYRQNAFNAGELSPRLKGRADLEKYQTGLQVCQNAIVLPAGGVMKRPGFRYINSCKHSDKYVELIPFEFSEDQAYVLEFGDLYMRVYMDGGRVTTPDAYTKLLLHMDGENGSITFTDDGATVHTVTANGNAFINTGQYYFPTASGLFDGAGDYLSISDHADFNLAGDPFTIDFWVRFYANTGIMTLWYQDDTTNGDVVWLFVDHEAERIYLNVSDGGARIVNFFAEWGPSIDTWYHVAVIRGWGSDANAWSITVNGYCLALQSDNGTMPNHDQSLLIGGLDSGNFLYDLSDSAHAGTILNEAVINDTQAKFGDASFRVNMDGGGNDGITFADSEDWDIFSVDVNDFTAEFWMYADNLADPVAQRILEHWQNANNRWAITVDSAGTYGVRAFVKTAGTDIIEMRALGTPIADDVWHHVVVRRKSSDYYGIFVDGYQYMYAYDDSLGDYTGTLYVGRDQAATNYFRGYLDDIRICHADPYNIDPSKPMYDESANHHLVTQSVVSGRPAPSHTDYKFGNGSLDFDGTDDYLYASNHADFDIWAATVTESTVDLWVKHTDHAGNECYMTHYVDGSNYWYLGHVHGGQGLTYQVYSGGVAHINAAGLEIEDTDWHHLAFVRTDGEYYAIYHDGIQVAYAYKDQDIDLTGFLYIGAYAAGGSQYFDGCMDEIRITHANSFSADPSSWLDDSSGTATLAPIAAGMGGTSIVPDTVTYKWGSGSCKFDGANGYITYADDAAWDILSQTNVTIDFWVKHDDHVGTEEYINQHVDGNTFWLFRHEHGTGIRLWIYGTDDAQKLDISGGEITDTNWHHVALVKTGNDFGIYKDGDQVAYGSSDYTGTYSAPLGIGALTTPAANYFDGYMDEVRIYHGNPFLASPNAGLTDTITMPTGEHTADTDTKLLLHFTPDIITVPTGEHTADGDTKLLMHMNQDIYTVPTKPQGAYSDNVISNGDFNSDATWATSTGWTIANGVASCDGSQTGNQAIGTTDDPVVTSRKYRITFELKNYVAGNVTPYVGVTGNCTPRNADGVYTETRVCSGNTQVYFVADSDFIGEIDNVRVEEDYKCKLYLRPDLYDMYGWIDELRESKGIARWTANFTVPQQEYPAGGGGTVYELVTPYTQYDVADIRIVQSTDTLFLFHPDYNVRKLTRSDHDFWSINEIDWNEPPWNEENDTATTLDPSGTTGDITVVASAPFFTANHIGAYFKMHSGFFRITAVTDSTNANATVKSDLAAHDASADWYQGAWDDTQGYPTMGAFHEDRLVAIGDEYHPLTVFFSATGDYENFGKISAPIVDTDPLAHEIWSEKQNRLKWIKSGKKLFLGTVGSEFWMTGETVDAPITPTSILVRRETTFGAEGIQPVQIGSQIIFVQGGANRLREWGYFSDDDGYVGNDLNILSEHMTKAATINKIQYAAEPHGIVWMEMSDGYLVGMTYLRDHKVIGFHVHDTACSAIVESIAVIPGTAGDELWAAICRDIGGTDYRFVERIDPQFFGGSLAINAFHVDSGLSYFGTPNTDFTGLDHIEGQTVQVFADGVYVGTKTVTTGGFTLAVAASSIHAGLAYNMNLETLIPDIPIQKGHSGNKYKRITEVMFQVYETLDFKYGDSSSNLLNMDLDAGLNTGEFLREFDGEHKLYPSIYIRQDEPTPFTLLSLVYELEMEDD
jgi:hypothetical protein